MPPNSKYPFNKKVKLLFTIFTIFYFSPQWPKEQHDAGIFLNQSPFEPQIHVALGGRSSGCSESSSKKFILVCT